MLGGPYRQVLLMLDGRSLNSCTSSYHLTVWPKLSDLEFDHSFIAYIKNRSTATNLEDPREMDLLSYWLMLMQLIYMYCLMVDYSTLLDNLWKFALKLGRFQQWEWKISKQQLSLYRSNIHFNLSTFYFASIWLFKNFNINLGFKLLITA